MLGTVPRAGGVVGESDFALKCDVRVPSAVYDGYTSDRANSLVLTAKHVRRGVTDNSQLMH